MATYRLSRIRGRRMQSMAAGRIDIPDSRRAVVDEVVAVTG
jgi:hypothetical protein